MQNEGNEGRSDGRRDVRKGKGSERGGAGVSYVRAFTCHTSKWRFGVSAETEIGKKVNVMCQKQRHLLLMKKTKQGRKQEDGRNQVINGVETEKWLKTVLGSEKEMQEMRVKVSRAEKMREKWRRQTKCEEAFKGDGRE